MFHRSSKAKHARCALNKNMDALFKHDICLLSYGVFVLLNKNSKKHIS